MKKMQRCCYCGQELGVYDKPNYDRDTCGAPECERFVRDQESAERAEAHEQLDRDMGWDRW